MTYDIDALGYYVITAPPPHLMNSVLLAPALMNCEFEVLRCASYLTLYMHFGNYLLVAL